MSAACQVCLKRRPQCDWDGFGYTKCRRCSKLINERGMTWQQALQEIEAREEEGENKRAVDFNLWRGER